MQISARHLLLSQDFFPMIGGAHHWLYNIYSRWPYHVDAFVGTDPRGEAGKEQQTAFDLQNHGSLFIHRTDLSFDDINILDPHFIHKIMTVSHRISKCTGNAPAWIHCLRAFPEGIIALAWKARSSHRRKVITYAHGEEILVSRTSRQLGMLARYVYRKSAFVIANSEYTRTLVHSMAPKARLVVIHPGVDSKSYRFPAEVIEAQRTAWHMAPHDVMLITIGRLEPRKNHANVLRAVRRLLDKGIPIKYLIVGGGVAEDNIRSLAKELNLGSSVMFAGVLSDAHCRLALASADLHVMPSIRHEEMVEGFGIVFLEAAAAGVPSIAGNAGGQPEAVQDNVTGLVVDGTSVSDLAAAIEKLATNPDLRKRMSQAAVQISRKHDWEALVPLHTALILG